MYTIKNSSTIYVSQAQGNDKLYNGLAPVPDRYGNGPFKTARYALQIIRELRTCGEKRPLTLAFTDDYFLETPLNISSPICGLTLESFGSRKKIIGGIAVKGWKYDRFRGVDCISAELPRLSNGERWNVTDLFVNGKRADSTRYPKEGSLQIRASDSVSPDQTKVGLYEQSAVSFAVFSDDLAPVERIEDAMIHYYHYWIDEHSPIESYDPQSGILKMQYRSRFSASGLYESNHPSAVFYYLTNVPNTFGEKNEWYLDREKGVVYYIPENMTADPADTVAYLPTQDHFACISGENIRIRNLEFTCTLGDYASKYTLDPATNTFIEGTERYGGDIQSVCWAPGAIRFQKAKRCSVSNCEIHGAGIHGIEIKTGCTDIRLENNRIWDVCAGGIKIFGGAYGEDEGNITRNCLIRGNHIFHCGKRYEAGCGVLVIHASHNEISDNEIHDTGYTGISVGWVWGYAPSSTYGNIIKGNHIYNIGRGRLSDLGGIYLLGKQHGTCVSENRIHDVKRKLYGGWGIYLDEGSSYVTVERNAVYNTQDECFHIHYGSHNSLKHNLFYAVNAPCLRASKNELHDEMICEQNILITKGFPIYHQTTGIHTDGFGRNLLWDTEKPAPIPYINRNGEAFSMEEWQTVFHQDRGSVAADPMIEGLEHFDFTLSDASPAFALGFSPLPEKTAKNKSSF